VSFECLDINNITGFDWDDGNILKNEIKHNLKAKVIEEIFHNTPLIIVEDNKHSNSIECRCVAFGKLNSGDYTIVIFTKRDNKIRVISARAMSKKERLFYEQN